MTESTPDVISNGCTAHGTYQTIAGLKTYVTGQVDGSSTAVLMVYDGFGYQPPTIQGADIIASLTGAPVFMPDFLDGGMPMSYMEIHGTPEGKAYMDEFLGEHGPAYKPKLVQQISDYAHALRTRNPPIHALSALGLGYGAKMLALACAAGAPVDAAAQAFPSKPDAADAAPLNRPHLLLASGSEPADGVAGYEAAGARVRWFPDAKHGFMGGLAGLEQPVGAARFREGYETFAAWMLEVLG